MTNSVKAACSIPCNLCGLTDVEEISRVDRTGNYLRTVICRYCGLVWSDPRPNQEEVEKYYTKDYRISYKGSHTPKLKHVYRAGKIAENRFLFLKEILRPGSVILDIGASSGEFVYFLRHAGYEASGIEPNEGYGQYARDQLALPVEIGMAQQFDLEPNSIDIVTMHHVFEHLDDPFLILQKTRTALRDGGHVVIEVPNIEGTCFAPIHRFHAAHLYNFNRETLESMGKRAGFTVLKTVISSDGGVITTIFKKAEIPVEAVPLVGNYEKIMRIIKNHKPISHYLTASPYTRPLKKLAMYAKENGAIRGATTGKEVLDAIVAEYSEQDKSKSGLTK